MQIEITYHIYEIRRKKNISLRQLEIMSGVSKSQINGIENGSHHPTLQTLLILATALKVSPEELYSYHIL